MWSNTDFDKRPVFFYEWKNTRDIGEISGIAIYNKWYGVRGKSKAGTEAEEMGCAIMQLCNCAIVQLCNYATVQV